MIEAILEGPIFSASVLEEKYLARTSWSSGAKDAAAARPSGTFRSFSSVSFSPVAVSMVSGRIRTDEACFFVTA